MTSSPKVTLGGDEATEAETPSDRIVKAGKKVVEITDALDRKITVRKLNALAKMDLARIVGAADVANQVVFTTCFCAFSVTSIDGEQYPPANSYSELRAMVGRLDDEGIEAVMAAVMEHFGDITPDEGAGADAVKNS